MKMKPTKLYVEWCFECPICGSSLWFQHEQLQKGLYINCCEINHGYFKLYGFKASYNFTKPGSVVVQEKSSNVVAAIDVLVSTGFQKKDATRLVGQIAKANPIASAKDLVRLTLAGV